MSTPLTESLSRREELVLLFKGERDEGVLLTAPCYTVPLAVAIAREVRPTTEAQLREAIYGPSWPKDLIDDTALEFIKLAFDRFRSGLGAQRGL